MQHLRVGTIYVVLASLPTKLSTSSNVNDIPFTKNLFTCWCLSSNLSSGRRAVLSSTFQMKPMYLCLLANSFTFPWFDATPISSLKLTMSWILTGLFSSLINKLSSTHLNTAFKLNLLTVIFFHRSAGLPKTPHPDTPPNWILVSSQSLPWRSSINRNIHCYTCKGICW